MPVMLKLTVLIKIHFSHDETNNFVQSIFLARLIYTILNITHSRTAKSDGFDNDTFDLPAMLKLMIFTTTYADHADNYHFEHDTFQTC
jgi:hypothetical protein